MLILSVECVAFVKMLQVDGLKNDGEGVFMESFSLES